MQRKSHRSIVVWSLTSADWLKLARGAHKEAMGEEAAKVTEQNTRPRKGSSLHPAVASGARDASFRFYINLSTRDVLPLFTQV